VALHAAQLAIESGRREVAVKVLDLSVWCRPNHLSVWCRPNHKNTAPDKQAKTWQKALPQSEPTKIMEKQSQS